MADPLQELRQLAASMVPELGLDRVREAVHQLAKAWMLLPDPEQDEEPARPAEEFGPMAWETWISACDRLVCRFAGCSLQDIGDVAWRPAWEQGMSPDDAVGELLGL